MPVGLKSCEMLVPKKMRSNAVMLLLGSMTSGMECGWLGTEQWVQQSSVTSQLYLMSCREITSKYLDVPALALDPRTGVMGRPIQNHEICYSNLLLLNCIIIFCFLFSGSKWPRPTAETSSGIIMLRIRCLMKLWQHLTARYNAVSPQLQGEELQTNRKLLVENLFKIFKSLFLSRDIGNIFCYGLR